MENPDVSNEIKRIRQLSPAEKQETKTKVSTKVRKLLEELEKKRDASR